MKRIGITQRVEHIVQYGERRDCLDQCWSSLALALGYVPVPLPNLSSEAVSQLMDSLQCDAVILSGGNSLAQYDPDSDSVAPERDAYEFALIDYCRQQKIPMIGVCRGMQMLNQHLGGGLVKVSDHVATRHALTVIDDFDGWITPEVNSYHHWGMTEAGLAPGLIPIAFDNAGHVEAFYHARASILGIMWHPEREAPFKPLDLKLIRQHL